MPRSHEVSIRNSGIVWKKILIVCTALNGCLQFLGRGNGIRAVAESEDLATCYWGADQGDRDDSWGYLYALVTMVHVIP
jgi:hypothetical protein